MKTDCVAIPLFLWRDLLKELERRGGGYRESGAFLLAKTATRIVSDFICYDDLDPTALDSGIIVFQGSGYVPLWGICDRNSKTVVADVHTHPGGWTRQSESDRTNPMIEMRGHIALILPHYAKIEPDSLQGMGVYEYRGNHKWKTWSPKSRKIRIV